MKEKNKEYWDFINKIVELQNDILDYEKSPIEQDQNYIQAGYGLIHDIYLMLYDMGYTKEEIDRDVAYT